MVEKAQVKSNIVNNKTVKKQGTSSTAATVTAFETPWSSLQTTTKRLLPRKSKPAAPIVTLTKTGPVAPAGKHSETPSSQSKNSVMLQVLLLAFHLPEVHVNDAIGLVLLQCLSVMK